MIVVHHLPQTRSVRVLWLCAEAGLAHEVRAAAYPPTADFLERNPFGTIPLVEVDGLNLSDSAAALIYLAQSRALHALLPPPEAPDFGEVLHWTILGESQLGLCANVLLAARFLLADGDRANPSVQFARERLLRALSATNRRLGDAPFLLGEHFTLADISVGYITGVARTTLGLEPDMPPGLLAWHDRLLTRPALMRLGEAD